MKTWSQRARGSALRQSPDRTDRGSASSGLSPPIGVTKCESCLSPLRSEVAVSNGRNYRGLFDLEKGWVGV